MFYIGLFILSFIEFIPWINRFILWMINYFEFYRYDINIIAFLFKGLELFYSVVYFMPNILYLYDILLILLLGLIIIKLNKEQQIKELKRLNYLSSIIACCMIIYIYIKRYISYITNIRFDIISPVFFWNLFSVILLISAITNGILVFRGKKNNKKH